MKIIILGAGISGALAAKFFNTEEIYDKANAPVNNHHAVMRIKDPRVGMLLGSNMESVSVKKGVYFKGVMWDKTNITINNMYSLKVSGQLSYKSILDLSDCSRFLLSDWDIKNINYGYDFVSINKNSLVFAYNNEYIQKEFDFCISTIPIQHMIKISGIFDELPEFKYNPIFVTRFNLNIDSTVHQTIYFPDNCFNSYRVTIEGKQIIFEAINSFPDETEIEKIICLFGISTLNIENKQEFVQKIGKIVPYDDKYRKFILNELTEKFNLFSLGRFAIWKQIRSDDVIKDLEVIQKMIFTEEKRRGYENKLAELHR